MQYYFAYSNKRVYGCIISYNAIYMIYNIIYRLNSGIFRVSDLHKQILKLRISDCGESQKSFEMIPNLSQFS